MKNEYNNAGVNNNISNNNIDISIIIPTKNEEKNIKNLLSDIKKQKINYRNKKLKIEIIVADARSMDKTKQIAKKFGAKIIRGGLPAIGRNRGAKIARGNILYMMDADIRLPKKDFILKSYTEFKRRKLDCAVVDNKPLNINGLKKWEKYAIKGFYEVGNIWIRGFQITKGACGIGTCMIFKKSSFKDVGGFDEKIYYAEDSALIKKLARNGYKFRVLKKPIHIKFSPRRPINQGVAKFFWNAAKLELYRKISNKEIKSKKLYQKITNVEDHFKNNKKNKTEFFYVFL
ncbi:MAG: glycosyltransferase [Candidatus Woesearchaeota archaeon]